MEEITNNIKSADFIKISNNVVSAKDKQEPEIASKFEPLTKELNIKRQQPASSTKQSERVPPKEEFKVEFGDASSQGIKFQVIDKDSGEVIRQYPFKSLFESTSETISEPKAKELELGKLIDETL